MHPGHPADAEFDIGEVNPTSASSPPPAAGWSRPARHGEAPRRADTHEQTSHLPYSWSLGQKSGRFLVEPSTARQSTHSLEYRVLSP